MLLLILCTACNNWAAASKGEGCTTAFIIDRDCDGYGVGSALGPDADDTDSTVNTAASALAKYGTLDQLLAHLGYKPTRKLFIATGGDDHRGRPNQETKPYATFAKVDGMLRAGDAVIWRAGTYFELLKPSQGGRSDKPILYMAYPGEKVILDHKASSDGFNVGENGHWVMDGLVLRNTFNDLGRGISGHDLLDVTIRNVEVTHYYTAIFLMNGLRNVAIEYSSLHDTTATHSVYLGARERPNINLTVRGNLIYSAAEHGFQHNGRVTNLIVENNIIHSNTDGCITLLEGVSHSSIQNNVCFNNGRAALIFWSYQSSDNTIRQYDQNYNTIRHNTFYINSRDLSADGVSSHPAILVDVQNPDSVPRDLGHNTYEANVFSVVTGAPVIQYRVLGHLQTDTYRNNVMYTNGPAPVNVAGSIHNWEWFLGLGALITGNVSTDPRFAAADPSWYKEPDRFDLRPRGDSPAVGRAGIGSLEAGSTRQTNPDAGAYEHVLEIKKNSL